MAVVTFTLTGNLADFGADPRAGVRVRIQGIPAIKVDDGTIYSDQPETVVTDTNGAFTVELVSTPGLWYRVSTPFLHAINPVHVAAYTPDAEDPTTGVAFPALTTVDLADVMDEDPTPGYDGVYVGGGGPGGVTDHAALTGRSTADSHPMSAITGLTGALAGKATAAQGALADTAVQPAALTSLVATTDPRLSDARTPTAHAASHAAGQSDQVTPAAIGAATSGHTHTGTYAPVLGADDNYVTDAEKTALHGHANKAALDLVSGTNTGDQTLPTWATISGKPAVVAAGATQADARTAIGAGTSSFSGAYTDLTGKPTLGTAAATDTTAYATAAQGTLAASASQPGHAHAGADITSGTVAYGRLPVGTTTSTVAAGDDSRITGATPTSRTISSGTGLTGGGDLTANRTLTVAYGTTSGTATEGNDARLAEGRAQTINAQTGTSYTLQASDAGKLVTLTNGAAITLNAPGSVFSAGQRVDIAVLGAGMATIVGTSGATAVGTPSLVTRAQYSAVSIVWLTATSALAVGDLA